MWKLQVIAIVCLLFGVLLGCQAADKTITLDLKSTHNGSLFYTEITTGKVGDDNKQTFNMLISTSHHLTWLASTNMSPSRGYLNRSGDEFNETVHRTRLTGAVYGGDFFHIHYDTFQVGPQSIKRQAFALMYVSDPQPARMLDDNMHGMIGLEDAISRSYDANYLMRNLFRNNYIEHLSYSLYINNTAVAKRLNNNNRDEADHHHHQQQQQQPEGALVLGGVDTKYYTREFEYAKMHEYEGQRSLSKMSLLITDIYLDWSRVDKQRLDDSIARTGLITIQNNKTTALKLDSSQVLYIGPKEILDTTHIGILGAKPILGGNFYILKDCRLDNKPDFLFKLKDGFLLIIRPEDYVIEHEFNNQTLCLSAFKTCHEAIWSFGTRFLRKYYTFFDYENSVVGFATPA